MTTNHHKAGKRKIANQPNPTARKAHQNKRGAVHIIARKVTATVKNGKKPKRPVGRPALNEGRVKLTCYILPTTQAALYARHGQTMGRKIDALVNGF